MGRSRIGATGAGALLLAGLLALPAGVGAQEGGGAQLSGGSDLAGSDPAGSDVEGSDVEGSAVCQGNNRTISGSVHGTNGHTVNAFVGLSFLDAAGRPVNPPNGGYWATNSLNGGLGPTGQPGPATAFTFSNVPNGACTFWLEVYPKLTNGTTNRTYYGGGLVRNRPLTGGATQTGVVYLPMTCGIGGGTTGMGSGETTGDTVVHAYVNSTPRGIDRVSYWSNTQNPNNAAYGFGVESPSAPYPSVLRVPAMASDQRYDVRVQIPSTGASKLAHIVPGVPVYQCEDTHLHVVWTPFGVATTIGRFRDTPTTNPFHDDIEWMADNEITTGYADGTYRPLSIVTRQAMSAFMYRLAGEPPFEAPGTPTFPDVGPANDFYDEIEWMAFAEISEGYEDGTYRPEGHVTRGAMSAFMYRLAGKPEPEVPVTPTFRDVPLDHAFFREIEWMSETEITTGYSDDTYRPGAGVSRQAMSAFMRRLADGPGVGV